MSAGSTDGDDLSDEERVLRCIEEHAEGGISTFAMTSELHLNAKVIAPIVDRLERERRIHGEKRGFIFYWKPGPDPEKAMPDVVTSSLEGADSIVCPVPGCGCKNQGKRALDNMFTHLKVKHGLERAEARRLYELPWDNAPSGTKEAARSFCRHPGCIAGPFPDGRKRHGHESFCKHNPKAISKAKGKASKREARTIKERELRRFDRELEEVSRADHPRP